MTEPRARAFFALTAVLVWFALGLQFVLAAGNDDSLFRGVPARLFNVVCYFTIESNLLVAVTTTALALDLHRRPWAFWVARLDGLLAITVTFIVFQAVLRSLQDLTGQAALADLLLHTVVPLLTMVGWVAFGPRGRVGARRVWASLAFPLGWLAFTLVRGEVVEVTRGGRRVGYYPYPFIDVGEHGYGRVAVNVALVAVVFVALGLAADGLDRWLGRRGVGLTALSLPHRVIDPLG